jgi:hypothetical protein
MSYLRVGNINARTVLGQTIETMTKWVFKVMSAVGPESVSPPLLRRTAAALIFQRERPVGVPPRPHLTRPESPSVEDNCAQDDRGEAANHNFDQRGLRARFARRTRAGLLVRQNAPIR